MKKFSIFLFLFLFKYWHGFLLKFQWQYQHYLAYYTLIFKTLNFNKKQTFLLDLRSDIVFDRVFSWCYRIY